MPYCASLCYSAPNKTSRDRLMVLELAVAPPPRLAWIIVRQNQGWRLCCGPEDQAVTHATRNPQRREHPVVGGRTPHGLHIEAVTGSNRLCRLTEPEDAADLGRGADGDWVGSVELCAIPIEFA
jgi:hypothetical protein